MDRTTATMRGVADNEEIYELRELITFNDLWFRTFVKVVDIRYLLFLRNLLMLTAPVLMFLNLLIDSLFGILDDFFCHVQSFYSAPKSYSYLV